MKKLAFIFVAILFLSCSETCEECIVVESTAESYCYEIIPLDNSKAVNGLIEGDIIPDKGYMTKGFVSGDLDRRWKNGIIPYFYGEGWSRQHQRTIDIILKDIESQTGIRFIYFESREALLESYKDGVELMPSLFGSSNLGRQGGVQQTFLTVPDASLDEGYALENEQTIKHDVGHTMGLQHEDTRPDRDEYINVHLDNIYPQMQSRFDIREGLVCGNYDLLSIMHVSSEKGSIDGRPSITTKDGEIIYENMDYSERDILTIKSIYGS